MATNPFHPLPGTDNTALDRLFYDVGKLTEEERTRLLHPAKIEGIILEVGPSSAPSLQIWDGLEDAEVDGSEYAAITVSGVGSSALGAAALARNAADAFGGKVLTVVSSFGMSDLAAEALGGYFLFGGINAMRHGLQAVNATMGAWPFMAPPGFQPMALGQGFEMANYSKDVKALTALLASGVETSWLIGHSKGNLVISEALFALRSRHRKRFKERAAEIDIVTFGARIAMPTAFKTVIDVMGDLDSFGGLNSRPDIGADVTVPNAWHHTNTELPFHVPVTEMLRRIKDHPSRRKD